MKDETILNADIAQESEAPVEFKKAEKKAGKRIGFNYIIVKSLKESKKNDVVKCFYIKSLTKWGFCVIKEGTFGDTKDPEGRDIKDRLMWQKKLHEELQDVVRIPRLIGSFEENGNYYLVMEYLRGKSLYELVKGNKDAWKHLERGDRLAQSLVKRLIQIVRLLQRLHEKGIVHRDVTPHNFMVMNMGKMALIDLELSYATTAAAHTPFRLGTVGYMSPEQQQVALPTAREDIYALGALMLQCFTSLSPSKLTGESDVKMESRVKYLVKDEKIALLILSCLSRNADQRPAIEDIGMALKQWLLEMRAGKARPRLNSIRFSDEDVRLAIQHTIDQLSTPLFCDHQRGWFSQRSIAGRGGSSETQKKWLCSIHSGVSGILYFLSKAKQEGFSVQAAQRGIDIGMLLIRAKYAERPDRVAGGLYYGSDGIAVALAMAIHSGVLPPNATYFDWIDRFLEKKATFPGIAQGIAGQGLANIFCAEIVPGSFHQARIADYVQTFLRVQRPDGTWPSEYGENRIIKGFGDGMSGIIYFLLVYARKCGDEQAGQAALKALSWLEKSAINRSGVQWKSYSGKELNLSLFEGSTGIALAFLKAYQYTGNNRYAGWAKSILLGIPAEMLWNKLSLGRGLAGIGEVYMEAYRVLGDQQWLDRASGIVQTLMYLRRGDSAGQQYWLVNHERAAMATLMDGNLGLLHFMLRYLHKGEVNGMMLE